MESRSAYRRTPAMMHSINADGCLDDVSDLWLERLGYGRDEVLGRASVEFLTEDSQRYAREIVLPEFFRTGRCTDIQYTMVKKDGGHLDVRLSAIVETHPDGTFRRSLAVIQDVSELSRLETKMVEAQKLESLGVLAGGIAHDFNNLLVSILGNAELARTTASVPSEAIARLEDVVTAAKRAAELCRQLLAYSGRGRFFVEALSVESICRELLPILKVSVGAQATLRLDVHEDSIIEADATQLRQVVMNLVMNAAEANTANGGVVSISAGVVYLDAKKIEGTHFIVAPGWFVFIEVGDTGVGMTPETVRRIFDPFFSTKAQGRGLGLAAVLGIVRGHHGTLEVRSDLGRGTRIRVYFPRHEMAGAASISEDAVEPKLILVVDDEASVRTTLRRMLQREGYRVLLANDGVEAVDLARARLDDLDAVLMDVTMPGRSGPEAVQALRAFLPEIPVVLMSGHSDDGLDDAIDKLNISGFLQKPFDSKALRTAIATLDLTGH